MNLSISTVKFANMTLSLRKKCPYLKIFGRTQYFPVSGLNMEIYRVNLPIQSECGKI